MGTDGSGRALGIPEPQDQHSVTQVCTISTEVGEVSYLLFVLEGKDFTGNIVLQAEEK